MLPRSAAALVPLAITLLAPTLPAPTPGKLALADFLKSSSRFVRTTPTDPGNRAEKPLS